MVQPWEIQTRTASTTSYLVLQTGPRVTHNYDGDLSKYLVQIVPSAMLNGPEQSASVRVLISVKISYWTRVVGIDTCFLRVCTSGIFVLPVCMAHTEWHKTFLQVSTTSVLLCLQRHMVLQEIWQECAFKDVLLFYRKRYAFNLILPGIRHILYVESWSDWSWRAEVLWTAFVLPETLLAYQHSIQFIFYSTCSQLGSNTPI